MSDLSTLPTGAASSDQHAPNLVESASNSVSMSNTVCSLRIPSGNDSDNGLGGGPLNDSGSFEGQHYDSESEADSVVARSSNSLASYRNLASTLEDDMLKVVKQFGTVRLESEMAIENERLKRRELEIRYEETIKELKMGYEKKIAALIDTKDKEIDDLNCKLKAEFSMRKEMSKELEEVLQALEAVNDQAEVVENVNDLVSLQLEDVKSESPVEVDNVIQPMTLRSRRSVIPTDRETPSCSTSHETNQLKRSRNKRIMHEVDTSKSNGFICVCGVQTTTKKTLLEHIKRYNPACLVFRCPKCPKRFSRGIELKIHMRQGHRMLYSGYGCRSCGANLPSFHELLHHRTQYHGKSSSQSSEKTGMPGQAVVHAVAPSENPGTFKCVCGKVYYHRRSLESHVNPKPSYKKRYVYAKAASGSSSRDGPEHARAPTGVPDSFGCICGVIYESQRELVKHLWRFAVVTYYKT